MHAPLHHVAAAIAIVGIVVGVVVVGIIVIIIAVVGVRERARSQEPLDAPLFQTGIEWVFRIGRTRDIRFSCGFGSGADIADRWQPVNVRYARSNGLSATA